MRVLGFDENTRLEELSGRNLRNAFLNKVRAAHPDSTREKSRESERPDLDQVKKAYQTLQKESDARTEREQQAAGKLARAQQRIAKADTELARIDYEGAKAAGRDDRPELARYLAAKQRLALLDLWVDA